MRATGTGGWGGCLAIQGPQLYLHVDSIRERGHHRGRPV